jgi:hypothetical protein
MNEKEQLAVLRHEALLDLRGTVRDAIALMRERKNKEALLRLNVALAHSFDIEAGTG